MSRHDDRRNENSRGSRWSGGNNEISNGLFYRVSMLVDKHVRCLTCLPMTEMQAIPGARLTMIVSNYNLQEKPSGSYLNG
jgi:hypothetical protein